MDKQEYGVHASHCCIKHGCKYGDKDCPVVNGEVKQKYTCESCDSEGFNSVDEVINAISKENITAIESKEKRVLDELKGWLQMGIACLESDNCYEKGSIEEKRLKEKVTTMRMVLGKIDELERSL